MALDCFKHAFVGAVLSIQSSLDLTATHTGPNRAPLKSESEHEMLLFSFWFKLLEQLLKALESKDP